MATSPPKRHRSDPAQIWMLQAEGAFLPRHINISIRRPEVERVLTVWTFYVLDCVLSAEWVTASFQYLCDPVANEFISVQRHESFPLPPLEVEPYLPVIHGGERESRHFGP